MFTRCPQCKIVHPLSAALISHVRGLVQCGQCGRAFNVLNFLFDDRPSGQAPGPARGPSAAPPVLGSAIQAGDATSSAPYKSNGADKKKHKSIRLAWLLATVVLVMLTLVNTVWTFRDPLLENPTPRLWLKHSGWLQVEQDSLLNDPQQFQLVSHDIHTHPTRSGILILSFTFVNLSQQKQVLPGLEITLLDVANQPVARRRLKPIDYLRPGVNINAGLATDVYLPVLLELGDPGEQAVGFEIRFL